MKQETKGEMLTPTTTYFIYLFFAAERWRVKISGYKLRYNRAAEGKQTKKTVTVCTLVQELFHAASGRNKLLFILTGK